MIEEAVAVGTAFPMRIRIPTCILAVVFPHQDLSETGITTTSIADMVIAVVVVVDTETVAVAVAMAMAMVMVIGATMTVHQIAVVVAVVVVLIVAVQQEEEEGGERIVISVDMSTNVSNVS